MKDELLKKIDELKRSQWAESDVYRGACDDIKKIISKLADQGGVPKGYEVVGEPQSGDFAECNGTLTEIDSIVSDSLQIKIGLLYDHPRIKTIRQMGVRFLRPIPTEPVYEACEAGEEDSGDLVGKFVRLADGRYVEIKKSYREFESVTVGSTLYGDTIRLLGIPVYRLLPHKPQTKPSTKSEGKRFRGEVISLGSESRYINLEKSTFPIGTDVWVTEVQE